MKNDLVTSIVVAIVGILIAYFVCNLFAGDIPEFSFSTIDSSVSADLVDPDPEVFNYKAINPTVEVYVGNCEGSDNYEECINGSSTPNQGNQ